MEERYAKFIDLIQEVRINVPLVDVLAGMPNYRKFLKDLARNKSSVEYLALADLGVSINLMPYSLYDSLSENTLKPTRMNVIDEVTKEELDALLDESKPFSITSAKISESSLDHEFKEFMAIKIEEIPEQEEGVEDNFEELPLEENLRIKNSIQDPPTDLMMKPLPKHLEYAFL
ncbi:hypothetical protein Tco_1277489 [Tanacetum coccineum]